MYEVMVRFEWGYKKFSFRYPHEAENFRNAILLCEECVSVNYILKKELT